MGFRSAVKRNVPRVDLQSYTTMICGNFKSGKTRAYKEIIERHYPNQPEAGLLLAWEPGYASWEIESYIDMHNRDWNYFRNEVVKGLIAEAKEGSPTKVIGVDTLDKCIAQCEEWVIQEINKKYGKKFTSLQEVGNNTNENGYMILSNELSKQFDALKNAGFGLIELCWTKFRETELLDGRKFQSLDLLMSATGQKVFKSQADIIVCLYNETEVLDREGNVLEENQINKKGKEIASNFHKTESYMYFKENEFISCAGGRFVTLPEKVSYSADNFLEVFEEAVKGQLKTTTTSVEDIRVQEVQQREEHAKAYAEQQEQKEYQPEPAKTVKELITEINDEIKKVSKANLTKLQKDFGTIMNGDPLSYQKSTDTSLLQQCLDAVGKYK